MNRNKVGDMIPCEPNSRDPLKGEKANESVLQVPESKTKNKEKQYPHCNTT